jgi:hypothetical protein
MAMRINKMKSKIIITLNTVIKAMGQTLKAIEAINT